MIQVRKNDERGHFNFGWLDTRHTFSFGEYHDPGHMGFRSLRVINEDIIEPGEGFPTHGHRDMEIITYILEGELAHQDSMGNEETIKTGELQRMSAGSGIRHSEYNASQKKRCHLLQIWILPAVMGLEPSYEQRIFKKTNEPLQLVVAPKADDALVIHQDAKIYLGRMKKGEKRPFELAHGRHAWIQIMTGRLAVNGTSLDSGDGAAVSAESSLSLETDSSCEFLLFDLN